METSKLDPQKYETKWWDYWETNKLFHADANADKEPFTILIPPPNVTDKLHMGHGLNNTIQDILVRWKRMHGYNSMWLPGTDHAGIATQMMVEKALKKEGLTRKDIGRKAFFERCVRWKEEKGGLIVEQLKKLGASCDWDREAYTMDQRLSRAVRKIFVDLYNKGHIYRGERLVNWDPQLETAVSDDELENRETKSKLWHISYLSPDGSFEISVATTRPETMLGDVAVAVNPDDLRYKDLIGKQVVVPIVGRKIPIIADKYVKAEFGTGCVKITPAHDFNDFAIGQRHKLPLIEVMDERGNMKAPCPKEFIGLDRYAARNRVVQRLEELQQLKKIEAYVHSVPYSERSQVAIEPRLSKQWFVAMKPLVAPAIDAVHKNEVRFYPDSWKKTYFHWLENIQDWCISRQLWWGHRIPIWYCDKCEAVTTGIDDPEQCSKCGSKEIRQDEDVLDTWFSSWLWPLSPLGWPDKTDDLKAFFPSDVLVTGAEIIFLWVARMIMLSHFIEEKTPFHSVYFNSIICDKSGRKFSKTLGNGIDPLEMIEKYGADAVRFTCVHLAPLGGRVRMDRSDFGNGYRFINKLWNAAQFLQLNIRHYGVDQSPLDFSHLRLSQKWLLESLKETAKQVNHSLETFQINEACDRIYHFIWHCFCDWGLESAKIELERDPSQAPKVIALLVYVMEGLLRIAAPFLPFVTEEIWQTLPLRCEWQRPKSLVCAQYPDHTTLPSFPDAAREWDKVRAIIGQIRSLRTSAQISPKTSLKAYLRCDAGLATLVSQTELEISCLANTEIIEASRDVAHQIGALTSTGQGWTLYLPVEDLVNLERERKRLRKEDLRIARVIKGLEGKVNNPNFTDKAPAKVVAQTKDQLNNMRAQLQAVQEALKALT